MKNNSIIAVDISKDSLDVKTSQRSFSTNNATQGFNRIAQVSSKLKSPLVVCEATGGYERDLMSYMHDHNIPISRINPRRVRAFCESEGIKAKTDPIDAKMIYCFAIEKELRITPKPDPIVNELAALMDRRAHLSDHLTQEKNRQQNSSKHMHQSIKRSICFINKELNRIESLIRKLIKEKEQLQQSKQLLCAVNGIGEVNVWTMFAYLPELGLLKRNEVVALAGLAPFNKDSGKTKKKRRIIGGRAKVRKALYMATVSAATHNPVIREYVDRLSARGKTFKSAITAAMRKLLIHCHIIMKNLYMTLAS